MHAAFVLKPVVVIILPESSTVSHLRAFVVVVRRLDAHARSLFALLFPPPAARSRFTGDTVAIVEASRQEIISNSNGSINTGQFFPVLPMALSFAAVAEGPRARIFFLDALVQLGTCKPEPFCVGFAAPREVDFFVRDIRIARSGAAPGREALVLGLAVYPGRPLAHQVPVLLTIDLVGSHRARLPYA